ncbi:MAG: acetate--CoA ligase family protein [Candidatus Buchananbacteria bacterium]
MANFEERSLDIFFHPKSVAIIGASTEKDKVGNDILLNIKNSYSGKIFPVNPKDSNIEGIKCFSSILEIKENVDLAIIAIPAKLVLDVLKQCGQQGCKNVIVISAGFKEIGSEGKKLEDDLIAVAQEYKINLLGPNCLGYISTLLPLNASFAEKFDLAGNIAFISQSGALGTAILDKAMAQKLGIGYMVSLGNKAGIDEIQLLNYFAADDKIKVIILYLEEIKAGRLFMSAVAKISKIKPVVVLKAGKTEAGQKAVSSHTGSLAGSAQAYTTAFAQAGVIEAVGSDDFFDLAKAFSLQPLPAGNRVGIITNAGGPGILLTDLLPSHNLKIADLSQTTKDALKQNLPAAASNHNPVDILGDAKSDRYGLALDLVLPDKNVDAVIVLLTPQKMTEVEKTAEAVGKIAKKYSKPVLLCFLGEKKIVSAYDIFNKYSLPYFDSPAGAVKSLGLMAEFAQNQKSTKGFAVATDLTEYKSKNKVQEILKKKQITEQDCRDLLLPLKFPLHKAGLAPDEKQALQIAKKIGYPVALKVVSPDIIHKSDVGGVKVNIKTPKDLKIALADMKKTLNKNMKGAKIDGFLVGEMAKGLEIILGVKQDPQFGPLVMVGAGGIYTEIFKDVAFRIAPFSLAEAKKMLSELKIYKMFLGARGQEPLDLDAVAELLVKLGDFSSQFDEIKEIDFNPVMVGLKGKGCKVVDLRFLK